MESGRRKTHFAFADQILVSGANFATGLLLARALGPAGYGQYTLLFNVVMFMFGIQIALINSPLLVLGGAVSQEDADDYFRSAVLGQVVWLLAAIGLISGFALLTNIWLPQWNLRSLWGALVVGMIGYLSQDFVRRYLFVRDRAALALRTDLIAHGLKLLLLAGCAFWWQIGTASALWIIGGTGLAGVASVLVGASMRGWHVLPAAGGLRRAIEAHWHFGKWLLAESLASLCAAQLVIYLTGHLISVAAVGAMTAAMNIIAAANVLFLALENVVPSRAAKIYSARGLPGLKRYLVRFATLGGACTLAIVLVAVAGAELWLRLLYGEAYAGNGSLLAWWGLYYLLGFAQRPFSVGLRVLGVTRALFHGTVAAGVVSLALSYPATRAFGVHGAMLALCAVQAATLLVLALSYRTAVRRDETEGAT
ncbi:MAG TPA: hypothetical protein VFB54_14745 [Burkholderiales bacterium]|nr:hypothetical protein [Burkholderiales bacterium]